jgi:glucose-1-phosphate adenylyltransferase
VNAEIRQIAVLTQYKSHSLDRHITQTWRMSSLLGNYVTPVPAQQRLGPRWYTGSADAIYQSLNLIYDERPEIVVVFGADHVYRMDPGQMIDQHLQTGAGVTIAGLRVPRMEATGFGVIDADAEGKVRGFLEKPADPPGLPDSPEESFASMGNYVFSTDALLEALRKDAADETSVHDMGGSIMPMLSAAGDAWVYDFSTNIVPGTTERDHGYWRDVGTIDSYYDAHLDLVSVTPVFNLYNDRWPIFTLPPQLPPAKFVLGGRAEESMVSAGVIIGGGSVHNSVVSPGVRVERGARVEDSVLMDGVYVGEGAFVRRAILDKNVFVPPWARIGVDHARDGELYHVSAGGVTVLGKGARAVI